MVSEKVFQIALLISVITHGLILSRSPDFSSHRQNKRDESVEVRYVKPPEEIKPGQRPVKTSQKEPFLKLPLKVTMQKKIPPPFINKERTLSTLAKPALIKPDAISVKKKITLPPVDMDKISNPSYMQYYQLVREKIRRAAYYNYIRSETGEVYVSFVISAAGALKDARLVEEKSSPSQYLRAVAIRSVQDASAFPSFPKELDYPSLSFNVVISFEIE